MSLCSCTEFLLGARVQGKLSDSAPQETGQHQNIMKWINPLSEPPAWQRGPWPPYHGLATGPSGMSAHRPTSNASESPGPLCRDSGECDLQSVGSYGAVARSNPAKSWANPGSQCLQAHSAECNLQPGLITFAPWFNDSHS